MIWGYHYFWKHPCRHPRDVCSSSETSPPDLRRFTYCAGCSSRRSSSGGSSRAWGEACVGLGWMSCMPLPGWFFWYFFLKSWTCKKNFCIIFFFLPPSPNCVNYFPFPLLQAFWGRANAQTAPEMGRAALPQWHGDLDQTKMFERSLKLQKPSWNSFKHDIFWVALSREWGNQPLHWYIEDETSLIPY